MNLLKQVFQFAPAPEPAPAAATTPCKPSIIAKNREGTVYASFPQERTLLDVTTLNDSQREFVCYHDAMTEREEIVLVIRGFFSLAECQHIVSNSEILGLEDLSHIYPSDYRNNTRVMVESEEFVDTMFDRLKPHLFAYATHSREIVGENCWNSCNLLGLNPRLRICKYEAGGIFQKHRDGACVLPKKLLVSHLTVMAYLNPVDKNDGGATRFFGLPKDDNENVTRMLASVRQCSDTFINRCVLLLTLIPLILSHPFYLGTT